MAQQSRVLTVPFYRGLGFSSQHPHDSSQPAVISVPGDTVPSSGLCQFLHECGAHSLMPAHMYIQKNKPFLKVNLHWK